MQQVEWVDVEANAIGQRIDNYLLGRLKGAPRTLVYRIIRKGEVRVNKKRTRADYRLQAGDQVRIPPLRLALKADEVPVSETLKQLLLNEAPLYESEAVLLLNKPAGLAVHGGSGVKIGLIEALRQVRPELTHLELVHRLDKGTSGCLLLAKQRDALNDLQRQLKAHQMQKRYLAWVVGHWPAALTEVSAPIDRRPGTADERRMQVAEPGEGKNSLTRFKRLRRVGGCSLIQAEPVTGRTHQIRVHATHRGYPLLGDQKYGRDDLNRRLKKAGCGRMFLHAFQLGFVDPSTGQAQCIEAPLDASWQQLEQVLQTQTLLEP